MQTIRSMIEYKFDKIKNLIIQFIMIDRPNSTNQIIPVQIQNFIKKQHNYTQIKQINNIFTKFYRQKKNKINSNLLSNLYKDQLKKRIEHENSVKNSEKQKKLFENRMRSFEKVQSKQNKKLNHVIFNSKKQRRSMSSIQQFHQKYFTKTQYKQKDFKYVKIQNYQFQNECPKQKKYEKKYGDSLLTSIQLDYSIKDKQKQRQYHDAKISNQKLMKKTREITNISIELKPLATLQDYSNNPEKVINKSLNKLKNRLKSKKRSSIQLDEKSIFNLQIYQKTIHEKQNYSKHDKVIPVRSQIPKKKYRRKNYKLKQITKQSQIEISPWISIQASYDFDS